MNQQDPIKKTGQGMIYIAWILGLFLLYLLFDGALKRQNNPNSQPLTRMNNENVEVVLKRNRYGHYLTGGSINGVPATFMIDTGATDIAVPENLAAKMKLQKGPVISMSTANGVSRAWMTTISTLKIGGLTLYNLKASINPGMNHSDEVLLGMAALKKLDFAQQGDTLILKQASTNY
ncbi:MAG TPA: TIGR02281 family clan AA aspartic protease [Aeromonadales bacterium]|nr:TIGR02281 family clan AA aspartic protease [Aeromonadales bacterium]